jgi:hypothetical protein
VRSRERAVVTAGRDRGGARARARAEGRERGGTCAEACFAWRHAVQPRADARCGGSRWRHEIHNDAMQRAPER